MIQVRPACFLLTSLPLFCKEKKRQASTTRNAIEVLRNSDTVHDYISLIKNCEEQGIIHIQGYSQSRTLALLPNPIAASLQRSKRKQRNNLKNKHQTKPKIKQSHGQRGEATNRRRSCRRARRPPGTRSSARPSALPCNR